jgi:hypothetical protein
VSSCIGIVNNPWFEPSLQSGFFDIDIPNRTATLYDDGAVKVNTTTLRKVGKSVAALLSVPDAQLAQFKNQFEYLSSFHVSQREMLGAVMRDTGTSGRDWTVKKVSAVEAVDAAKERPTPGTFLRLWKYSTEPSSGQDMVVTMKGQE